MRPPSEKYLEKLALQLFPGESGERQVFLDTLRAGARPEHAALVWRQSPSLPSDQEVPSWFPDFVTLARRESGPGRTTLHDAGAYYVLDPSSIFEASVFSVLREPISLVADLCASPGGKSMLAWRWFHPEMLIANEVIRNRCGVLISNVERMRLTGCRIISADVSRLVEHLSMDLVIVDAPCSGQSLILKGIENPGGFHPRTIEHCERRQRRIIAQAASLVKPGGYLAYMTCTFSREENEDVCEWFLRKFPDFRSVPVPILTPFQSALSTEACYRLWPSQGLGAGGFTCLLKKSGTLEPSLPPSLEELRVIRSYPSTEERKR